MGVRSGLWRLIVPQQPGVFISVALGLAGFAAHAATLVQRPYLQNQREDRVSILWSTRENVPAILQYSADPSFPSPVSVTARVRAYPASQTGLGYTFYLYEAD